MQAPGGKRRPLPVGVDRRSVAKRFVRCTFMACKKPWHPRCQHTSLPSQWLRTSAGALSETMWSVLPRQTPVGHAPASRRACRQTAAFSSSTQRSLRRGARHFVLESRLFIFVSAHAFALRRAPQDRRSRKAAAGKMKTRLAAVCFFALLATGKRGRRLLRAPSLSGRPLVCEPAWHQARRRDHEFMTCTRPCSRGTHQAGPGAADRRDRWRRQLHRAAACAAQRCVAGHFVLHPRSAGVRQCAPLPAAAAD
jgi:hypothetical protein